MNSLAITLALAAATPAAAPATPATVIAAAPAADWRAIAAENLLVMELAPDALGQGRRIVIQLMPPPFSQGWVANLRRLAAAHWWDGTSVYRVQDNYVAQWGDADGDDKAKAKPLPAGLAAVSESEYTAPANGQQQLRPLPADPYAKVGFNEQGWPEGGDGRARWPLHCYGMVGVARDLSPNTGSGAELYAVIGTPARQLDRNIALVGRVIEGIEHLSSLPRGPAPMGVYTDPGRRTPIRSVRLASEIPAAERPRFEYLDTLSASFARLLAVRTNRNDAFFRVPAGGIDICNAPVPVRRAGN